MYMALRQPPPDTFCLFSVLWYTFQASKKILDMAQTALILTKEPTRRQKKTKKNNNPRSFWTVCNIFCPRFVADWTL